MGIVVSDQRKLFRLALGRDGILIEQGSIEGGAFVVHDSVHIGAGDDVAKQLWDGQVWRVTGLARVAMIYHRQKIHLPNVGK